MMQNTLKERIIILLSTGFYSGYMPFASGTFGTMVGVLLYLPLSHINHTTYLVISFLVFLLGVWVSDQSEAIFMEKDSSKIVIDEIAGFFVTMYMIPPTPAFILSGFLLFRFFDIWKPHRRVEKLKGGMGVMLDDIIAGLFANLVLHISMRFI